MKFLTPILLLGIAIGLFFWYVKPQYAHIQDLQTEETQYSQALSRANADITTLAGLVDRYNSLSADDIARLQNFLPDSIDGVNFALNLNSLVSRYGINLKNIKVDDLAPSAATAAVAPVPGSTIVAPYSSLGLSFSVDTTYNQFVQMLTGIESSQNFMDISSIAFTAPTASNGPYTFTVGLKTYWLK